MLEPFVAPCWHHWSIQILAQKKAKNPPQLLCSKFSPGWDNRAIYLRLMSLQTKPPRETTHIWQSRPVCESQRDPVTRRTDRPLCSPLTLDPSRLCCQPTGCQHWPSLSHAVRHRTGESGQGNVSLAVWLTHTHVHTYAPTSLSDLTYTPRPENSFSACKCRALHCNLWLWG